MVYAQWGVRRSMCTRCRAPRWTWRGRCRACWGSHHCPSHRSSLLPARARLKKANCQFDQIRIINPHSFVKTFAQSLPIMRRRRCWCIEKEMVMIRRTIWWWVFTRSRWEKKEAKMKKREIRQSEPQMIVVRTTGSDQNLAFLIISYQTSRWIIVAVIIVMLAHS